MWLGVDWANGALLSPKDNYPGEAILGNIQLSRDFIT